MNILTQTKDQIAAQLTGERFAQALIGGFHVESAWEYDFGGTLTVRIGYYNGIARYACFIKATLGASLKFAPEEVEACLLSIAATWTTVTAAAEPSAVPTIRYRCTEGAVTALAWHKDELLTPPRAEILAANESGVQAYRAGRHLGIQFHPEVTPEIVAAWNGAPELVAETERRADEARDRAFALFSALLG